tara:strand:- start:40 stop:672 length:633 start_codon:yes stop_codon:yes gene_type:complete
MLILASASKARRRLLNQAKINHIVIISGINEKSVTEKNPKKLVQILANQKANTVASQLLKERNEKILNKPLNLILGCDSVFEFNGEIYGKPKDSIEAINRLKRMSGKKGILHTGHSLVYVTCISRIKNSFSISKNKTDLISTEIEFCNLSIKEIENYVATKEPLNCAGGFALEGQGGLLIKSISGCYSNVIGLSLPWLRSNLNNIEEDKI